MDNALWLAGILTEAGVVSLLLFRHVWRNLPVFVIFLIASLLGDLSGRLILAFRPGAYTDAYLVIAVADSILEICVLIELAWSVLLPIRRSLPRGALLVISLLVLIAAGVIWPFAGIGDTSGMTGVVAHIVRVQQTSSILRIVFFLALTGLSQLLSMGWRDREIQVATGLGFYSLVSLSATLLHSQGASQAHYGNLMRIVAASYLCSMIYWVVSFAQKEAERRQFTPQMQSFLLALAGSARSQRVALANAKDGKRPGRKQP
ncbi:MAG TPA: hypothetical protein VFI20_09580 [Terracidiphilus sp.]|nr:hypothetical protein [Terracidiphilus sp.]